MTPQNTCVVDDPTSGDVFSVRIFTSKEAEEAEELKHPSPEVIITREGDTQPGMCFCYVGLARELCSGLHHIMAQFETNVQCGHIWDHFSATTQSSRNHSNTNCLCRLVSTTLKPKTNLGSWGKTACVACYGEESCFILLPALKCLSNPSHFLPFLDWVRNEQNGYREKFDGMSSCFSIFRL